MSRYIDADKLQEEFKELHGGKRSLLIDTQPTADVVEVVRCKDCKHKPIEDDRDSWPTFPNEGDNPCPCQCDDGFYSWVPKDDFYCGFGERADT